MSQAKFQREVIYSKLYEKAEHFIGNTFFVGLAGYSIPTDIARDSKVSSCICRATWTVQSGCILRGSSPKCSWHVHAGSCRPQDPPSWTSYPSALPTQAHSSSSCAHSACSRPCSPPPTQHPWAPFIPASPCTLLATWRLVSPCRFLA